MAEPDKSLDVLGVKPVAEAVNIAVTATVDGVGAFLSRICLPAAEEFGLLLRDKVGAWRAANANAIVMEASRMVAALPSPAERHAHPRLVGAVLENGSWADQEDVQRMWAGLLATACTESGQSQENLIFINLLSQLTTSQARILNFACEQSKKAKSQTGLVFAEELNVKTSDLFDMGTGDLLALDLEIDHLRALGLLDAQSGLDPYTIEGNRVTPSAIGLQLYVRCQGNLGTAIEYFALG